MAARSRSASLGQRGRARGKGNARAKNARAKNARAASLGQRGRARGKGSARCGNEVWQGGGRSLGMKQRCHPNRLMLHCAPDPPVPCSPPPPPAAPQTAWLDEFKDFSSTVTPWQSDTPSSAHGAHILASQLHLQRHPTPNPSLLFPLPSPLAIDHPLTCTQFTHPCPPAPFAAAPYLQHTPASRPLLQNPPGNSSPPHLHTMHTSLPPSSICSGTMPTFLAIAMPVSPPVKLMQFTRGCSVR